MSSHVKCIMLEVDESKDIRHMYYYIKPNILFVRFINETFYRYNEVPMLPIIEIASSVDSVGKYFHANIKNNFKYELIAGSEDDFFDYLHSQGLCC